jgi:hypothetical protein
MGLILFFFIFFFVLYILKTEKEGYGWSCSFTPNVDYYKEDWLLGGNSMAQAAARDSIMSPGNL